MKFGLRNPNCLGFEIGPLQQKLWQCPNVQLMGNPAVLGPLEEIWKKPTYYCSSASGLGCRAKKVQFWAITTALIFFVKKKNRFCPTLDIFHEKNQRRHDGSKLHFFTTPQPRRRNTIVRWLFWKFLRRGEIWGRIRGHWNGNRPKSAKKWGMVL